ncbi:NmrA family NAD(P)-binding protein [Kitasatospora sp. NPDC086791]|uniref:NmrA family NAD(P)-binding protein n=1 Tax=Kitasatospora sp. NPDC086791 TaxID=3155178 RepID=UPI00342B495A
MTGILVIGATGSAGRRVVSSPIEGGHEVRALVRDPAKAALPAQPAGGRGGRPEVDRLPAEPRVVELIARRAKRVVHLSADVADLADDEPAAVCHREIERSSGRSGGPARTGPSCGRSTSRGTRSPGPTAGAAARRGQQVPSGASSESSQRSSRAPSRVITSGSRRALASSDMPW